MLPTFIVSAMLQNTFLHAFRAYVTRALRDSCRQLFKNCKFLPLKSQYIFSFLLFIAKIRDLYELKSEIHNINTIFSSDLHTPTAKLTTFQKDPFILELKSLITFLLA